MQQSVELRHINPTKPSPIGHNYPGRCDNVNIQNRINRSPTRGYPPCNNVEMNSQFQCINSMPSMKNVPFNAMLPQPPVIQRQDSSTAQTRYKTELCNTFDYLDWCRYGTKCQFAHGVAELRLQNRHKKYKTELCRTFHTTGFCSYGQRCNFIHNADERRGPPPSQPSPPIHWPLRKPQTLSYSEQLSISSTNFFPVDVLTSARLSPTPSIGSDGNSVGSSETSPPRSPKYNPPFMGISPSSYI